jgi:genome maintenance exonuclease 1
MFIHCDVPIIPEMESKTIDGKRFYITPSGNKYPSVTTVIGSSKKHIIEQWRNKVGHEVANKISAQASGRGTRLHTLCENYINNVPLGNTMPDALEMFRSIRPVIDENINNIHYQECALYSDMLQLAGRVDLIAEWNGVLSIIDFKTSRKIKTRDMIEDYFAQETAYALMLEERIGTCIDQIVTLIAVENEKPLVFIEKTEDHIDGLVKVIENYRNESN